MMASSWNLQYFQNQWLSLRPLTLILAVIGLFSVTESVTPIQLRGEVGQNVTFHCPSTKNKPISLFYFQKNGHFVNGYYAMKDVQKSWENTIHDNKTSVHMFKLNISHSGKYDCIVRYTDNPETETSHIHLTVTANFSKPTTTKSCDKNHHSCQVICASHGGYPSSKISWNIIGNTSSQMWKVLNNSDVADPYTKLINISSVASFNCSYGEQKSLSCSVGDVTSEVFVVCKPKEKVEEPVDHTIMIAAICAVAVVVIGVPLLLWTCRKKRQAGAAAGAVRPEEVIILKGTNGEGEAS